MTKVTKISSDKLEKLIASKGKKLDVQNSSGKIRVDLLLPLMAKLGTAKPKEIMFAYNELPEVKKNPDKLGLLSDRPIRGYFQKMNLAGGTHAKDSRTSSIGIPLDGFVYNVSLRKIGNKNIYDTLKFQVS